MEVIGALKKSKSETTIYFCEYNEKDFVWNDIIQLLLACHCECDLDECNIFCVAVESIDNLIRDRKPVGIAYNDGEKYVCLAIDECSDLKYYLQEMTNEL